MKLAKLCAALVVLTGLNACSTTVTQRTVDTSCIALKTLSYAGAKAGQETADDPGNRYDTPETVGQVAEHNARWRALCTSPIR